MGISLPSRALWLGQPAFIPEGRAVVLAREGGKSRGDGVPGFFREKFLMRCIWYFVVKISLMALYAALFVEVCIGKDRYFSRF
jgi:hypothetical protein